MLQLAKTASIPLLLAAAVLGGCVEEADRAAKKRIFSPEEPPKQVLAASQPIDAARLAGDAALAWRVLTMGPLESFERIGPFRYKANASYDWSLGGARTVKLAEQRLVEQASATDFYLRTDNDRDQGYEAVSVGDRAFLRARYRTFREHRRDRGQAARLRDDACAALRSALGLLDNRITLEADGEESLFGRPTRRYRLLLAEAPLQRSERDPHLPEVVFPNGGPDADTRRRLDFEQLRTPRSAQGRLWVDAQTGVPLKAELSAQVRAPGEGSQDAQLTLKVRHELQPSDSLSVTAPQKFLPDEDRPNAVAAALERFGVERAPVDGGTPAKDEPTPAREPADEPDSDPED